MAEPKSYKTRFIEPGIISYEDTKQGVVLVSKETLDRMAASFRNKPVIFIPEMHDNSDEKTAFNFEDLSANPASGIITGIPYWGDDGWQWVEMSVWDEAAQQALDSGYSVSCAYDADEDDTGGIWHEIPYTSEVTDGKYMHMAIVPKPRYEGSRVLANSKGDALNIFKKKNAAPPEPEKKAVPLAGKETPAEEKAELMNDDTMVDVNGTPVPLHELVANYEEKNGTGGGAPLADDDEVGLSDGTKVTVADLKAAYTGGGGDEPLENAEAPTDTVAAPVVDEGKQRANSAPVKKTVNVALKNAAADAGYVADKVETQAGRLERGRTRYSLPCAGTKGGKA
ncbi:MAG: DUF2213 domain-containing protein [Dehalococcoidia bacterium]|jgi:hypothetical protein